MIDPGGRPGGDRGSCSERHPDLRQIGRALFHLQLPDPALNRLGARLHLNLCRRDVALMQPRFAVPHPFWSLAHPAGLFAQIGCLGLQTTFFTPIPVILKLCKCPLPVTLGDPLGISAREYPDFPILNRPDRGADRFQKLTVM